MPSEGSRGGKTAAETCSKGYQMEVTFHWNVMSKLSMSFREDIFQSFPLFTSKGERIIPTLMVTLGALGNLKVPKEVWYTVGFHVRDEEIPPPKKNICSTTTPRSVSSYIFFGGKGRSNRV